MIRYVKWRYTENRVKHAEMPRPNRSRPAEVIDRLYACQPVTCYELRWFVELNVGINSVCESIKPRDEHKGGRNSVSTIGQSEPIAKREENREKIVFRGKEGKEKKL